MTATLVYTVRCPVWLRLNWPLIVSCRLKKAVSGAFCQLVDLHRQVDLQATATLGTDVSRVLASPRLWNSRPDDLRQTDIGCT